MNNQIKEEIAKYFSGRKLVLASMHKKEVVIAPLVEKHLGVEVCVPKNFNTDKFGTFTRDIKRKGSQLDAARKKLLTCMKKEGFDLGISSEGSFGSHPSIPFIQSNYEIVLFIDLKNKVEIRGNYRTSETNLDGKYISSTEEAIDFANRIGFPDHGVIIKKNENSKFGIYKNIDTLEILADIVQSLLNGVLCNKVFIETDMRAFKNPTRMRAIEKACEDLIKNIYSLCPKCKTPGFVKIDFERGLPCSYCGLATDLPLKDIYKCSKCNHNEKIDVTKYGNEADPQYCGYCNP